MPKIFFITLITAILIKSIYLYTYYLSPAQTLLKKEIITTGQITSIPEIYHQSNLQFDFTLDKTYQKIHLTWYRPPPVNLQLGDVWKLHITYHATLKKWLQAQSVYLEGSVVFDFQNQLIQYRKQSLNMININFLREWLYHKITITLGKTNAVLGFISALTVGIKSDITEDQWTDMRATGTNHLMAIAGLHIGFISLIVYHLINFFWRKKEALMLIKPAQEAAAIASLIMGFIYSALSGFSLPAQRAICMLSVYIITLLARIKTPLWESYFFAILFILFLSPLSLFTATFWLSFGAVGLLIYTHSNRVFINQSQKFLHHGIKAQWTMALGLIPFGLLFFQEMSLTGLIANCIAIPFIGFIILPLCFLGILFHPIWTLAGFLLNYFWKIIHYLANIHYLQYSLAISFWQFSCVFTGILLLLAPKGFPHRWLGWWGFLPIIVEMLR